MANGQCVQPGQKSFGHLEISADWPMANVKLNPWDINVIVDPMNWLSAKLSCGHPLRVTRPESEYFTGDSPSIDIHSPGHPGTNKGAGLGGSVGCPVWLETRSRVQPPPLLPQPHSWRLIMKYISTVILGDWSWNTFLRSFSRWFKRGSFWQRNAEYWLTAKPAQ